MLYDYASGFTISFSFNITRKCLLNMEAKLSFLIISLPIVNGFSDKYNWNVYSVIMVKTDMTSQLHHLSFTFLGCGVKHVHDYCKLQTEDLKLWLIQTEILILKLSLIRTDYIKGKRIYIFFYISTRINSTFNSFIKLGFL